MVLSKQTTSVALFFVLTLFSPLAFGGILDYGTPYTDIGGVTWSGTSHFQHPTSGLKGDIDWIVYGPGQFPYTDSSYSPPANQYTYTYQIKNTGTVGISDFMFSVNQTVDNLGSFVSPSPKLITGTLASATDFVSGPGGWVDWAFSEINPNNTSAGLVYTSPKAPMEIYTGLITDGGSSAIVDTLPAPGPNDIPEPGTLVLLSAGLGFVVIARRYFRR